MGFYQYPDGKNHSQLSKLEWEENEYLPAGWKCKTKAHGLEVMAGEGDKFGSYNKAVEFMKNSEVYTKEDIKRFYCYPDGKTHDAEERKREEAKKWEEKRKESEARRVQRQRSSRGGGGRRRRGRRRRSSR